MATLRLLLSEQLLLRIVFAFAFVLNKQNVTTSSVTSGTWSNPAEIRSVSVCFINCSVLFTSDNRVSNPESYRLPTTDGNSSFKMRLQL